MGVFVEGDDVMAKKKDFERDNRLKTVLQQTDQRTLAKLILDFCALNADNRSLQSMYDRLLKGLDKADDHIKESFRNKLRAVVDRAQGVGWGYHDYLVEGFVATYPDEED